MKYEVFASQLDAHIGQSPVRGGKAINTDREALTNIEKYLAKNFGTPTAKLRYKDYSNGTSLTSEDATFAVSLVILTIAGGAALMPRRISDASQHISLPCQSL